MNIKFVLPALLVLCGAACMSPVHAADYRCMVFSGADGKTPEASTNADGKYAIKAVDLKAAEAGALAAATRYKKNSVTLTKAQCDAVTGASSTATSAPTTTTDPTPPPPPAAPATGGTGFYCLVYEEDTNQQLKPPADVIAKDEKGVPVKDNVWLVPAASLGASEDDAVALAKAKGMKADSAMCASSLAKLSQY